MKDRADKPTKTQASKGRADYSKFAFPKPVKPKKEVKTHDRSRHK